MWLPVRGPLHHLQVDAPSQTPDMGPCQGWSTLSTWLMEPWAHWSCDPHREWQLNRKMDYIPTIYTEPLTLFGLWLLLRYRNMKLRIKRHPLMGTLRWSTPVRVKSRINMLLSAETSLHKWCSHCGGVAMIMVYIYAIEQNLPTTAYNLHTTSLQDTDDRMKLMYSNSHATWRAAWCTLTGTAHELAATCNSLNGEYIAMRDNAEESCYRSMQTFEAGIIYAKTMTRSITDNKRYLIDCNSDKMMRCTWPPGSHLWNLHGRATHIYAHVINTITTPFNISPFTITWQKRETRNINSMRNERHWDKVPMPAYMNRDTTIYPGIIMAP